MEWVDEGIVLAVRRLGETGVVADLLTREHGRHAGLVHGGISKTKRGILQPGNRVSCQWRSRLVEQLGAFRLELLDAHAARLFDDVGRLAALAAACALTEVAVPERVPHAGLYQSLAALLAALDSPSWPSLYVRWELLLLAELGYGLDLSHCAATGVNDGLTFVSPKTGRAVSASAGEPYRDKLLALPAFLVRGGDGNHHDIAAGLTLAGYFLERHVLVPHQIAMPPARSRLVDRFVP